MKSVTVMKTAGWIWILSGGVALFLAGCSDPSGVSAGGGVAGGRPPADNNRCFVCHANYAGEKLAARHARGGVGCETCHGPSDDHCQDEANLTPPSILFARAKIASACMTCHAEAKLKKVSQHQEVFSATQEEIALGKVWTCTDCHGKHRLQRRTVRWDKTTRALIKT